MGSMGKGGCTKGSGGNGNRVAEAFNISLIVKWWWRLREKEDALWSKVIGGIHNLKRKPQDVLSTKSITGVWNNIANVKEDLSKIGINMEEIMVKDIGAGNKTRFWVDKWCGDSKLKDDFPALYQIEKHKQCLLKDRIQTGGFIGEWKTKNLNETQSSAIDDLKIRIGSFRLNTRSDKWRCVNADDGLYHVRDLRYALDSSTMLDPGDAVIQWTHDVSIKVVCMVWRANLGRLPTAEALIKRGIPIESPICSHCENEDEDVMHALWRCPFAKTVWFWIFKWCDIPIPAIEEVVDLIRFLNTWGKNHKRRKTLISICYGTLWMIWNARCDRVFKRRRISPTNVADNIKSVVYTWLKYRRSKYNYKWEEWCAKPFD